MAAVPGRDSRPRAAATARAEGAAHGVESGHAGRQPPDLLRHSRRDQLLLRALILRGSRGRLRGSPAGRTTASCSRQCSSGTTSSRRSSIPRRAAISDCACTPTSWRGSRETAREAGSITDVPGVSVGHYTDATAATGCTVVLLPEGAVGGVDVRGSAPARERPTCSVRLCSGRRQRVPPDGRLVLRSGRGNRGGALSGGAWRRLPDRRRSRADRPGGGHL